jgi:hypothetical protein
MQVQAETNGAAERAESHASSFPISFEDGRFLTRPAFDGHACVLAARRCSDDRVSNRTRLVGCLSHPVGHCPDRRRRTSRQWPAHSFDPHLWRIFPARAEVEWSRIPLSIAVHSHSDDSGSSCDPANEATQMDEFRCPIRSATPKDEPDKVRRHPGPVGWGKTKITDCLKIPAFTYMHRHASGCASIAAPRFPVARSEKEVPCGHLLWELMRELE